MAQKIRKVGIYHHPESAEAREFAREILARLEPQLDATWIASAWDPVASTKDLPETDLLITIGGDGTVLRAARAVVPHPILILGVDMGRLAFLTELVPDELRERLDDILAGDYSVDQRTMLAVEFEGFGGDPPEIVHALNDVTVGRTSLGRPVYVNVRVNGDLIGVLRGDGVVVASATGSTGYSLSAGGPILDPSAQFLVLTPVAPHLAAAAPLVLPPDCSIDLSVGGHSGVAASVDGQGALAMDRDDHVRITRSPHVARLLRHRSKPFFAQLGRRLAWLDERRLKAVHLEDEVRDAPPSPD